jgi:hypothetical protein
LQYKNLIRDKNLHKISNNTIVTKYDSKISNNHEQQTATTTTMFAAAAVAAVIVNYKMYT